MKKSFTLLIFFCTFLLNAQTEKNPVVWKTSVEKISDTEYNLIFNATILDQWHLYSQYNPEGASLPLEITAADENPAYVLVGKAEESKTYKEYTETWEKDEIFFKDKATLTQRIQLTNKDITTVKLNLFAQVCKELCIQFDEDFTFSLDGSALQEEVVTLEQKDEILSKALHLDLKNKERLQSDIEAENTSLWMIFFFGLIGGFLALLTPCVFPMIPLTVSFFTKQSQNKTRGITNAVLYGFFIVLIYVLLSIPFHLIDGIDPNILNNISTNVWPVGT